MLQSKNKILYQPKGEIKVQDTIILRKSTQITYEKGAKIERPIYKKVNITRMINETAKVLKEKSASEKIQELQNILMEGK